MHSEKYTRNEGRMLGSGARLATTHSFCWQEEMDGTLMTCSTEMRSFGSGMCLRNSGIYVTWRESNMVNKEKGLQFLSRVCCYLGCFYPVVLKDCVLCLNYHLWWV